MNQASLVYISWLLIISAAVCRREGERQRESDEQKQRARGSDSTGKEGYTCQEGL
ncbi:hypothetical protein QNH46_20860 [Paenibacillus woosongensis]|uniref:Uncharacterized protein n=1 Tax=Paenibacillus woosongensis TaxID=307580 RepID=A0AA95L1F7_9BACL|nr:hypothetical protein [Paenibacillus woosongensis]WHX48491.1 hypothetical protein QNH46_20860 [Paenibacillus woosongensis]